MATSPTQIRIDSNVKTEANELFKELYLIYGLINEVLLSQIRDRN